MPGVKRYWRLVLKYANLPDCVEGEWIEECCLDVSPEECIDRFNQYCVDPDKPREIVAAIPIMDPAAS